MPDLPRGTVNFLFTDVEGSTRLWQEHPDAMAVAMDRHDALLRQAVAAHGGVIFKTMGDAVCAAFPTAPEGLEAALEAPRALLREAWGETGPLRVRMALHTGQAEPQEGDYRGQVLNRLARLLSAAHGSQVLLSLPTASSFVTRCRPVPRCATSASCRSRISTGRSGLSSSSTPICRQTSHLRGRRPRRRTICRALQRHSSVVRRRSSRHGRCSRIQTCVC